MAGLPGLQRSFADLQQIQANAYAAAAKAENLPVANLGSFAPLGGIFNANAMADLAVQAQIDYVSTISRLGSSVGPDVDSYIAPFGIPRQGAGYASQTGSYTIPQPASGRVLALSVGAIIVRDADQLQYQVVSDTSAQNAAFDSVAQGYYLAQGQTTITFSFVCLTAGSVGNCAENTINTPYTGPGSNSLAVAGTITNPEPVSNGTDAESDANYITRFQSLMIGGSVGTSYAYLKAALSVAPNLTVQIGDTLDTNGLEKLSWFTVFVNVLGQAGGPSSSLISNVQNAVEAVRAAGTRFTVISPTLLHIAISGLLHSDGTTNAATMVANATAAVTSYVNSIGMDPVQNDGAVTTRVVPIYLIAQAMRGFDADGNATTGVAYPSNVQINGGYGDLTVGYGVQPIVTSVSFGSE